MPQGDCPRVQRECSRGSSQGWRARCTRLRRLPRRAPDHGSEKRGLALECPERLGRDLWALPRRSSAGSAQRLTSRSATLVRRQLPRPRSAGRQGDGGELCFMPRSAFHSPFEGSALDRERGQPAEDLWSMSPRRDGCQIQHWSCARDDRCWTESSGGEVDPLDLLGTDSGDARLHAAAQPDRLSGEADSSASADRIRRYSVAHEPVVPQRWCSLDSR